MSGNWTSSTPMPKKDLNCVKCGKPGHFAKDCKATGSKCPRCYGNHTAWSTECPMLKSIFEEKKKKLDAQYAPKQIRPIVYVKKMSDLFKEEIKSNPVVVNKEDIKNSS